MSRTFKDRPYKIQHPDNNNWVLTDGYGIRKLPTIDPKQRKAKDTEDHWMTTPGWWVKMTMTKPERRSAHFLEKKVLRVADIEEVDMPDLGRKPHIYFW